MKKWTMANEPAHSGREGRDLKVLARFTEVFCCAHHGEREREPFVAADTGLPEVTRRPPNLCPDCRDFLAYALSRRLRCPLDPKPACKHCQVHCYRPGHREQVRQIMRFSGKHLVRRGRLDLLWHYLF